MLNLNSISKKIGLGLFVQIVLIAVILTYGKFLVNQPFYRSDFLSFYSAALISRQEPAKIYDFNTQTQYQQHLLPADYPLQNFKLIPFANPPLLLLFFLPLTYLPVGVAYKLAILFNLGLLALGLGILSKIFQIKNKFNFWLISLSFAPVYATLFESQSSISTLLIFISVFLLLEKQTLFQAALVSTLLVYKPQLGLVLWLYLILKKDRRVMKGLFVGMLFWGLITIGIFGRNLWTIFPALSSFYTFDNTSRVMMISWFGFFTQVNHYLFPIPISFWTILTTILAVLIGLWVIFNRNSNLNDQFSLIITMSLLCGLHIHYQELTLLLLVFAMQPATIPYWLISLGWLIYFLAIFAPFYPASLPFLPTLFLVLLFAIYSRRIMKNQEISAISNV